MNRRIQAWLTEQLDASERQHRCLVPLERLTRDRMLRAKREGLLEEVMPHVYARPSYWASLSVTQQAEHVLHALQQTHPDWVFAGPSAALANGLAVSNRYLKQVWLVTNRKSHMRADGHICGIIVSGDEVAMTEGLRTTSFGRTLGDCLRIMDFRSGLAVADSALRLKRMTADELKERIAAACPRMQGMRRIRSLIQLADALSESGGESIARAAMLELGIAPPQLQRAYPNEDPSREPYRVDYAWQVPGGLILGELDGSEKYKDAGMLNGRSFDQVIRAEHRRQSYLEAFDEVLRFVRFDLGDVMKDGSFLRILLRSGVPRTFAFDDRVLAAGGSLRCR